MCIYRHTHTHTHTHTQNEICHLWTTRRKKKLKEQKGSRLTKPKNGLTSKEGKGTGVEGWEWKDKGRGKKGCIV